MVLTVSHALTPVPLLVQGGQYLLSLLKAGFNDVISETQRVMGTALLRRLLGLFGKFFTAPLSLSLLVKKPARGWRQQEQSSVETLLPMVGDVCEGTGKADGSLAKGSQGVSQARCWYPARM